MRNADLAEARRAEAGATARYRRKIPRAGARGGFISREPSWPGEENDGSGEEKGDAPQPREKGRFSQTPRGKAERNPKTTDQNELGVLGNSPSLAIGAEVAPPEGMGKKPMVE